MHVRAGASVPVHLRALQANSAQASEIVPVQVAQRCPHSHLVQMPDPATIEGWEQLPRNRKLTETCGMPHESVPFPNSIERSLSPLLQLLNGHGDLILLLSDREDSGGLTTENSDTCIMPASYH